MTPVSHYWNCLSVFTMGSTDKKGQGKKNHAGSDGENDDNFTGNLMDALKDTNVRESLSGIVAEEVT